MVCKEDIGSVMGLAQQIHGIVEKLESVYCRRINTKSLGIIEICRNIMTGSSEPLTEEQCQNIFSEINELNLSILADAERCHPEVLPLAEQIQDICEVWL